MATKKQIAQFQTDIKKAHIKDQFAIKFLSKPLIKYIRVRLSKATDKTYVLADIFRKLCNFEDELSDTIDDIEKQLADKVKKPTEVYFPEDAEMVSIENSLFPNSEEDMEFYIKPINDSKTWNNAIADYTRRNKPNF